MGNTLAEIDKELIDFALANNALGVDGTDYDLSRFDLMNLISHHLHEQHLRRNATIAKNLIKNWWGNSPEDKKFAQDAKHLYRRLNVERNKI